MAMTPDDDVVPVTMWGPADGTFYREAGWRHVIWGLIAAFGLSAVYNIVVLLQFTAQNPGLSTNAVAELATAWMTTSGPGVVISLLILWSGFLLGVGMAGAASRVGFRRFVGWSWVWPRDLWLGLGVAAALQVGSIGVGQILEATGVATENLGNASSFSSLPVEWLPVMALAIAVGAPIVEELFFRGLVLNVAAKSLGVIGGVLVSSALFGAMHVQTTLAASVYTVSMTAAVGVVLAVMRVRTNRLGPSIITHIAFNATSFALAVLLAV